MTSDVPAPDPGQRRKFALLVLGLGAALVVLVVALALITKQYWMLLFLIVVAPNVYIGVREFRASRR